jgi:tetratricopeptide (TPR) repeat protein
MRKAQREFLSAAMSAYLQNKQADQAGELLDVLQSSGKGGSLDENLAVMRQLATAIRGHVDSLRKENKKADADELSKNFTEFLDKVKGDDTSKLPQGVILFLSQGYGAVDQHAKAAELFGQLLAKTDPAKDAKKHREFKFLQARAYRQAGQFDQAKALMLEIVGEPLNPKGARGWGYGIMEARKEYCLLWEDQKIFSTAVTNWVQLSRYYNPRGLPIPVKFIGQRPQFLAVAEIVDAQFGTPVAPFLAVNFRNVYPAVAESRSNARQIYFDLFFEAQRCSARAYTTIEPAKIKGGQETINQKLAEIGQKFHELLTRNDDVQPEVKEKIHELMEKHPQMKKKFDELTAVGPKS